jgi:hypothetical protein
LVTKYSVQYPLPPLNVFPSLSFDLGWAHGKFTHYTLDSFNGWMKREKRQGDERKYRFEATCENGEWKAVISACDPENSNPFDDRNLGSGPWREIKGLPKWARRDIEDRAKGLAVRLRKRVEDERRWLLDRFNSATFIPPPIRFAAYALDGDWLIRRDRIMRDGGFNVTAERRCFSLQQAQEFVAERYGKLRPLASRRPEDPSSLSDFESGTLDREIASELSARRLRELKLANGHPDDCECDECEAAGKEADLAAARETLKILDAPAMVQKWRDLFDKRDRKWALP